MFSLYDVVELGSTARETGGQGLRREGEVAGEARKKHRENEAIQRIFKGSQAPNWTFSRVVSHSLVSCPLPRTEESWLHGSVPCCAKNDNGNPTKAPKTVR
jgi:hypothetical protein